MFHLSHLMYALAACYVVAGILILRRLRKPTCRICLFRQGCPDRPDDFPDPGRKPCYDRDQTVIAGQQSAAPHITGT